MRVCIAGRGTLLFDAVKLEIRQNAGFDQELVDGMDPAVELLAKQLSQSFQKEQADFQRDVHGFHLLAQGFQPGVRAERATFGFQFLLPHHKGMPFFQGVEFLETALFQPGLEIADGQGQFQVFPVQQAETAIFLCAFFLHSPETMFATGLEEGFHALSQGLLVIVGEAGLNLAHLAHARQPGFLFLVAFALAGFFKQLVIKLFEQGLHGGDQRAGKLGRHPLQRVVQWDLACEGPIQGEILLQLPA